MARGGDSNIKMPGCVCLVSENRPILNETVSCKTNEPFKTKEEPWLTNGILEAIYDKDQAWKQAKRSGTQEDAIDK